MNTVMQMVQQHSHADEHKEKLNELVEWMNPLMHVSVMHEGALDKTFDHIFSKYDLNSLPMIGDVNLLRSANSPSNTVDQVRLALVDAHIVDAENAPWEQIIQLREDSESQAKFIRLMEFSRTNYEGKSQQEILDDIEKRLNEYNRAAKKHGFATRAIILQAIFRSRALQLATAGTTIASIYGKTFEAMLAASVPLMMDVGHAAVEIWKKQVEFNEAMADHPLAYIVDARRLTQ